MNRKTLCAGAVLAALWFTAGTPLYAAEPIIIEADQSQMVSIQELPGAIVVGNPTIADVSVQGKKLFIHGRSFGTTNLIVLDLDGEAIANFEVTVRHLPNTAVALFKGTVLGAARFSYTCAPLCEADMQIGDAAGYNAVLAEQTKTKIKLATGAPDSKAEAPVAPQ